MGIRRCAQHTLVKSAKSRLKRNKTYVFDAMNLLYSLCKVVEIADLLGQSPPVPTREIVSYDCIYVLNCMHVFLY